MNTNQHLARRGLDLVEAERQRVAASQVLELRPLGVMNINLAASLLCQSQEDLLEREGDGLVPLSGLGLPAPR